jgi:hypothetical protein
MCSRTHNVNIPQWFYRSKTNDTIYDYCAYCISGCPKTNPLAPLELLEKVWIESTIYHCHCRCEAVPDSESESEPETKKRKLNEDNNLFNFYDSNK